jgi:hypothetical protein
MWHSLATRQLLVSFYPLRHNFFRPRTKNHHASAYSLRP